MMDVCFVMDATGSMWSYIDISRQKILEIADNIQKSYDNIILRMAFVAYRDVNDGNLHQEVKPFTEDIPSVKDFISGLRATGGGDTPEDVFGGLDRSINLEWEGTVRLIVHFGDAPHHGFENQNRFDASKWTPIGKDLMKRMIHKNIDYYFAQITVATKFMTDQLKLWYDSERDLLSSVEMTVLSSSSEPRAFFNTITSAIYSSVDAKN